LRHIEELSLGLQMPLLGTWYVTISLHRTKLYNNLECI